MLGKNPTSVQNAITLVQKKDMELCIIEGLHNHDSGHEFNNIYDKENDKTTWDPNQYVIDASQI